MSPLRLKQFLILVYFSGLMGLILPDYRVFFLKLTPYTLWFTGLACLWTHPKKDLNAWIIYSGIFLSAWLVEVLGVKTGKIFGHYSYGQVLGAKFLEAPLTIGINWLLLVMCSHAVVAEWNLGGMYGRAALGAGLMTLLDFFIEPVAIYFNFWYWENDQVPVQNFLAWWLLSFFFHLIYQLTGLSMASSLYRLILLLQFLFFIGLNLLIKT